MKTQHVPLSRSPFQQVNFITNLQKNKKERKSSWNGWTNSPVERDKQIKTIMKYHLTFLTMAIIKKNTNNKRWRGSRLTGTLVHYWCEWKLAHPLWKTAFFKKLKTELLHDPAIPLLGKNTSWKRHMHSMSIAALVTKAKIWKHSKCPPTEKWKKKT